MILQCFLICGLFQSIEPFPIDGHLSYFQWYIVMDSAAGYKTLLSCADISVGEIPRSKIAGSKNMHILKFDRSFGITLQNLISHYLTVHFPSKEMRRYLPSPGMHWIPLPSCEMKMGWNTRASHLFSVLQSLATDKGPK